MTKVILPELGEGIEKATVSFWPVKEGQKINQNDDLVEMSTDKATFNVPAPCSGIIAELVVEEGTEVKVGDTLALINETKS